jgi:hypothetical protein
MTEPCPPISDLLPGGDDIRRHAADCVRCRALLARATHTARADDHDLGTSGPSLGGLATPAIAPGHVCTIAFADLDEFLVAVVVDHDGDETTVAPISNEPHSATEWDLLLETEVLGYAAAVQLWNTGHVLAEQIHEVLTAVAPDVRTAVAHLHDARRTGARAPEDLVTGVPVLGDADPRITRRERDAERARPYWQPAAVLERTPSLGAFLRERRERSGDDVDLADVVEAEGGLEALEDGRLDISASVPVKALARLLTRLDVGYHEGIEVLVRRAVEASARSDVAAGAALARRRTRSSRAAPAADPATARRRADDYVAALRNELLP